MCVVISIFSCFVNKNILILDECRSLVFILISLTGQDKSDDVTCKNFVLSTLKYHNNCKTRNGNVCLMGKYHNLLYIAIKLAFDWSLQDNGVVAALLDELYACEGTFERIFLG